MYQRNFLVQDRVIAAARLSSGALMSEGNISRSLLLAVGLLLLIGSALAFRRAWIAGRSPASRGTASNVVRLVKDPQPAPPFTLKDLSGKSISLSDSKGKVILLNFWATWCPPCNVEIPELVELQNQYKDRLQVIGVSEDDDPPEKVLQFAQRKGINYPIVMATPELIDAYGGVSALPTTFVVDDRGRVVQKHMGLVSQAAYTRELQVLLGLPTDAHVETFVDSGQVFLSNVAKATELPGVDMSHLSPEQKKIALHRLNAEGCTCGCGMTLAECRVSDEVCPTSRDLAAKVVSEVARGIVTPPAAPAAKPAGVSTP